MNFLKQAQSWVSKLSRKSVSVTADTAQYTANRKMDRFMTEGYIWNVIGYRCINEIVRSASQLNIEAYNTATGQIIPNHQLAVMLNKPNLHGDSFESFISKALTYYYTTGSTYIERVFSGKKVLEINVIPSQEVEVKKGNNAFLAGSYKWNGRIKKEYPVDPINGACDLFHFKEFNPIDPLNGLNPMESAAYSIDMHNLGMQWNNSLLKNSGRLSGILKTEDRVTEEQYSSLRDSLKQYTGTTNAAKAMILEGGLSWQQIGISPVDMDFQRSLDVASRNIASAFGVPFALVVPEASTYNNMTTAREMLYEQTVIPLLNRFLRQISTWLMPDQPIALRVNADGISALEGRREIKFERMIKAVQAGLLTRDEARLELGYDELGGMAGELIVTNSSIPLDATFSAGEMINESLTKTNQNAQ